MNLHEQPVNWMLKQPTNPNLILLSHKHLVLYFNRKKEEKAELNKRKDTHTLAHKSSAFLVSSLCYMSLTSKTLRLFTTMSNMWTDLNLLKSLGREMR
jgi:hypothetical protein